METEFKVGDEVESLINVEAISKGTIGTIISIQTNDVVDINWEISDGLGHNLDGMIPTNTGWSMTISSIKHCKIKSWKRRLEGKK